MHRDLFWLSDDAFARLQPHLPVDTRGKPRVDDRRVISGIVHVIRSGCGWVDAPAAYGPSKTLYNRFVRWAEKGLWTEIFEALSESGGPILEVVNERTVIRPQRGSHRRKSGLPPKRWVAREIKPSPTSER